MLDKSYRVKQGGKFTLGFQEIVADSEVVTVPVRDTYLETVQCLVRR